VIFDSLSRPGVPLFVMLTGWMLLAPDRKDEPIGKFFRRRLGRVILPLVTWSLVAWGWLAIRDHHPARWAEFGRQFLNGPVFYHLWYVYVLLGLYLAIPLLRPLAAGAAEPLRRYTLGLWALASSLLPLWYWWGGFHVGVDVPVVTTYVGYLLAGVWLAATPIAQRTRRPLVVLVLATVAWTVLVTARLTDTEPMNVALLAYGTPNVLAMSLGWYVLLTQPGPTAWIARHAGALALVRVLAATSYGVYLVHPLILNLLDSGVLGVRITGASIFPFIGLPLLAALVLAVSAGMMVVARRVPVLGRLLGAA
jgi:surface polysaccharide O-acyltransferase-like enzyme